MIKVDLHKSFGSGSAAVNIHLKAGFPTGKVTALTGASGVGKTTVLRMIAGLTRPNGGTLSVHNELWYDASAKLNVKPQRRKVGFVFQDYALFPHLNVRKNIAFGLAKAESRKAVDELLEITQLNSFSERSVSSLSGGQQQRVALARALAPKPDVLLLDEPLSALDVELRQQLRHDLKTICQQNQTTVVLATHDLADVFHLADHVVCMKSGGEVVTGPPDQVYHAPQGQAFRVMARLLKTETLSEDYRITIELNGQIQQINVSEVSNCAPGHQIWLQTNGNGFFVSPFGT